MLGNELQRLLRFLCLLALATGLVACGAGGEPASSDAAASADADAGKGGGSPGGSVSTPSGTPEPGPAPIYGPRRFTRGTGAPQTFAETFPRCAADPCRLVVVNGEPGGGQRVSSATIHLNGRLVLGPSDFNQRVERIVVPVSVADANQIRVELRSAPGSFLTITLQCESVADLQIEAQPGIGLSTWDDGTVSMAIPLVNEGTLPVTNVTVTGITAGAGTYQGPRPFAYAVGNLRREEFRLLDAMFGGLGGVPSFPLVVRGTFGLGAASCPFQVQRTIAPPAPPAPVTGTPGQFVVQRVPTSSFPPVPPPLPADPNAEQPIMVPIGPARQLFPPTPTGTSVGTSAGGALVQIPRNTTMRSAGVPPDPNAARGANVVLATYNTGISFSTDGGQTFTDVNLFNPQPGNPARTSFFPTADAGLCCDQVVVYLAQQNLFVWLLQYWPVVNTTVTPNVIASPNRLRIAWATPAAIAADFWNAWTWGDLTGTNVAGVSSGLGIAANEWLDYPDMAWSADFLYVGIDQGFTRPGLVYTGRRIVARLSLADMANPAATVVNYAFARLTGSNGLNKTHFVQGAPGRMVVGSLDNSSTLRVFTWPDSVDTISPSTVAISQIQQGANYTSTAPAPDNSDWVAVSFPGNISGATYRSVIPGLGQPSRDEYLFAFQAGVNAALGRPRAYVRLETLTPAGGGYNAIGEYDIWNPDYAFAMGGLGTAGTEIGIALGVGGGTIGYPQFAVGFMNDFVVFQVTGSNATQVTRFGDYIAPRLVPGAGLFAVELYDVILNPLPPGTTSGSCATVGCSANMRYVEFGRPPPPPIN